MAGRLPRRHPPPGYRPTRTPAHPEYRPREVPALPADAADRRIDLAAALARLTPRQRALLICRFYEDLTETQAAQALGISPNTVKSQTRRALARLRDLAPELLTQAETMEGRQ
ncbi:MAG: sigma-70 family RNA polymerase sigma factor [Tetrasphaera jenkinsii]|jgi:RNA polymerase sigma factor (sigma-70 family)|nr:sigma-70 family RNA polymerase sigma factor [Tetrasphaera jenkinsii]